MTNNKRNSFWKKRNYPRPSTLNHPPLHLAPLASEAQKSSANIQFLTYDFACRIVRLFQYLNKGSYNKEYIISKQVFRSGTSIAANMAEAQHPQSDSDFLSKASIALKECRETQFWLNLLHDNGYINDPQHESLDYDVRRILKILITITSKVRERLKLAEESKRKK